MELEELEEYFLNHLEFKTDAPENRYLGTEYEMFVLQPPAIGETTYRPLPVEGECGLYGTLSIIDEKGRASGINWTRHVENGCLIGLSNPSKATITIEPGAQIEFSGAPLNTLEEIHHELQDYLITLKEAVHGCGGEIFFIGVNPLFSLSEIPLVDKERYHIMFPYMKEVGSMGQNMMKGSSATQVSLDYFTKEDLERKFVLMNRLSPFFSALFANSPLFEQQKGGWHSIRGKIWHNTDPYRAGLPNAFLKETFQLQNYIDWALKASPYFLVRDEKLIKLTHIPFQQLLEGKHPEIQVTMDDWQMHLGMVFPDVRIKKIIEMRSPDALLPHDLIAVPALLKALIYHEGVFEEAFSLLMNLPLEDYQTYRMAGPKKGLQAEVNNVSFLKIGRQLFEIALSGLGSAEEKWLLPYFNEYIKDGKTPADKILESFDKNGQDIWKWLDSYLMESDAKSNE